MPDLPVSAHVSGQGRVTYVYADGRTVTLHGTHPYRDNNPGNLRYPGSDGLDRARAAGAIGIDGGFAIFPDGASGEAALRRLIERRGGQGQSVQTFLAGYAPAGENNLAAYIAAVTRAMNCQAGDLLSALSDAQRAILAETIMIQEGWRSRRSMFSPPVAGRAAPSP